LFARDGPFGFLAWTAISKEKIGRIENQESIPSPNLHFKPNQANISIGCGGVAVQRLLAENAHSALVANQVSAIDLRLTAP